jgi:N-acetylglucosamine transport system permease protein
MKKTVRIKAKINWRKELSFVPGYILISFWVLLTFYLISWIIFASFSTTREIFSGQLFQFASGFHISNYLKVWRAHMVSTYFLNSLIYSISACTIIILIAAPAAYALARFKFRLNKLLQNMFVAAMGIPTIMIIMPLFSLATTLDMTNSRLTLIFLYVCMNVPFTIFFLLAFYSNLSVSYEEAAYIDGCGPIRTFWNIMFPLSQPGVITVTIFNFITIWNEFFMALIFANNAPLRPVGVGLYTMIQSLRYTGDWAGMFAAVVIVFLPTFILFILFSERIIAGVTGGGIKG